MSSHNADFDVSGLAPESAEPAFSQPMGAPKKKGGWLVAILVIIIIVAAVLFYLDASGKVKLFGGKQENPAANFDSSSWKAVFLTNGQVYFGHLKNANSAYPELSDIYYLQVQEVPIQPAQAATNEAGVQAAETKTEQKLILVKFGTEVHKPTDKMQINKDHIMFYEDLAADSPVVKSIEDYLKAEAAKVTEAAK
ncbi:MAG: hypothetical protein PHT40_02325 [Patescibacteria group bacterium]|nr:hypothetical protein [Patescibacteria group bacterium]